MADEKKTETKNQQGAEGVTEAEIRQFREHLGIKDQQDDGEPLLGKMEQVLDAFADIDSQDILNALNSLSDDDE